MDPNGLPLQVINPVTGDYYGPRQDHDSTFDTVQAPSSEIYSLAAILPTCPGARALRRQPTVPVHRACQLMGPWQEQVLGWTRLLRGGEACRNFFRSYEEPNKETRTEMSHFGKIVVAYTWRIKYCLLNKYCAEVVLFCCFTFSDLSILASYWRRNTPLFIYQGFIYISVRDLYSSQPSPGTGSLSYRLRHCGRILYFML